MKTINRIETREVEDEVRRAKGEGRIEEKKARNAIGAQPSSGAATRLDSAGTNPTDNVAAAGDGGAPRRIDIAATGDGYAPGQIENREGFWMLSFGGRLAVLPQHQGLFYIAYLLASPHAEPIAGVELAGEVFEQFGEHEDFRPPIPRGYRDDARVAKILLRKQKRLEGIVDRDEEDIVVRVEALRELMVLDELKRIYFSQIARDAKNAGEVVSDTLRELHAMLACAVDARGNPNRVARDFGMHLLHYVLMPSNRVSAKEKVAMFVYRPAVEGN